ncbi:hypothetical protein E0Z10_g4813 [Xylaria hypoxylon]|uniref:Glutamine synthetase n=1 Tax=Xylaria hypoxylon TaxID=37992 RepID=A0A4Z0YJC8_9PEZI|nr:hypothetical protein E0Z10_g4813 [Xylaria hypoxylon]
MLAITAAPNGGQEPYSKSEHKLPNGQTAHRHASPFDPALKEIGKAKYIRIYWHDYTSSAKCRVVPAKRVYTALRNGDPYTISITKACLGLLPNDFTVPGVTGTGVYLLSPDWGTLKQGPAPGHLSCYAFILEEDGLVAHLCPRGILCRAMGHAALTGLTFKVGFEMEFTVLERTGDPNDKYRKLSNDGHAWSMARTLANWGTKGSFNTAADEILQALEQVGIEVEQFHPEGGPGQYEIVLPPQKPLEACDVLLHTRQIVESAAARHGFRVTLHPRPFPPEIGNGSHAHLSITSENGDHPRIYEQFYGGILEHFPAIFAFTNSHQASYERMVDGLWAGGRWVTWGTQNKETPLRKCKDSHWEVKVMDGIANPYLALAALIFAGTEGAALTMGDCTVDPAKLSSEERSALGIQKQFPGNLEEALEALTSDAKMVELFGKDVVERYITVKKAEIELLNSIPKEARRNWVIERY